MNRQWRMWSMISHFLKTHMRNWVVPLFFLIFLIPLGMASAAGNYEVLFSSQMSQLSEEDMKEITLALGYKIAEDGNSLEDQGGCGSVNYETRIIDLDGDGITEVVVIAGNTCTSGNIGSSVFVFIKGKDGKYERNISIPASGIQTLTTKSKKYADLLLEGPGSCHPVWRWNGRHYAYFCSHEEKKGACAAAHVQKLCDTTH